MNFRFLCFSLCTLLTFLSYGQNFELKIDSLVHAKIDELSKLGINEVGFTRHTTVAYGYFSKSYLFWKNNNLIYIQKFEGSEHKGEESKISKPLVIQDSVFFEFYKANRVQLKNEEVEHFRSRASSTIISDPKNNSVTVKKDIITRIHTSLGAFFIQIDNEKFYKYFDYFKLEEFDSEKVYASKMKLKDVKYWEEKGWEVEDDSIYETFPEKNINFNYNNNLKIVEWDNAVKDLINELETQNLFNN